MKVSWLRIVLLALCCAAAAFEVLHFRSSSTSVAGTSAHPVHKADFVLLPSTEIGTFDDTYAKLLPQPSIQLKSWEPTLGDMEDAERDLPQISKLTHRNLTPNSDIDARQYLRQYLAIEMEGNDLLFVNGLCRNLYGVSDDWRKRLIFVNDGGPCHWQAIYNPATHSFANFSVNGVE